MDEIIKGNVDADMKKSSDWHFNAEQIHEGKIRTEKMFLIALLGHVSEKQLLYTAKLMFHQSPTSLTGRVSMRRLASNSVVTEKVTVVNRRQHGEYTGGQLCSRCATGSCQEYTVTVQLQCSHCVLQVSLGDWTFAVKLNADDIQIPVHQTIFKKFQKYLVMRLAPFSGRL